MNKQRTSFSIQNTGDVNVLLNTLKRIKPTTIGVMDNPALLKRIMNEVGGIKVGWLRFYRQDDGALWQQGQSAIDWLIEKWLSSGLLNTPNTYLSVLCEPAADDPTNITRLVSWTVEAMKQLKALNIRAVVLNAQTSVFRKEFVDQGLFDPLLRELADGYHVLGWHEYGGAIIPIGAAGGNKYNMLNKDLVQPGSWPTAKQVKGPPNDGNWLIGRLYWWDDRARAKGINPPMKVITEAGQDAQGAYADVDATLRQRYSPVSPHTSLRGWHSWGNMYNDYYGRTFSAPVPETTQLAFMKWLDNIYDDTVLGINYFVWSPNANDWDTNFGFDYSRATTLHDDIAAWSQSLGADETPVPDPPKPPDETSSGILIPRAVLEAIVKALSDVLNTLKSYLNI